MCYCKKQCPHSAAIAAWFSEYIPACPTGNRKWERNNNVFSFFQALICLILSAKCIFLNRIPQFSSTDFVFSRIVSQILETD